MVNAIEALFEAFREDHALFGHALYQIAERLRASDGAGARAEAEALNRTAGAHIAFEEHDFYPSLAPFLDADEIERLYEEHAEGRQAIVEVIALDPDRDLDPSQRDRLLKGIEQMEAHVSECGELFGAMGGLTADKQEHLLERLKYWRRKNPSWTELPEDTRPTPV